jgi:hypothetical protein
MSLDEKSDVRNHLSARHHTQIHLTPPASQPDAIGVPHEENTGTGPKDSGSDRKPLRVSVQNSPGSGPYILSKTAPA